MSMMCLSRIESLSDRFAWRIIDGELGARLGLGTTNRVVFKNTLRNHTPLDR